MTVNILCTENQKHGPPANPQPETLKLVKTNSTQRAPNSATITLPNHTIFEIPIPLDKETRKASSSEPILIFTT